MIVGVLRTYHTQYTWDSSIYISLFNRTTLQGFVTYLTGALCVHSLWFYRVIRNVVGVLTTCHTQYTSDSSICIFSFNRTTLTVFVTYLTGALYVHPLWFYRVIRNVDGVLTTCHTQYTWDRSIYISLFNRTTLPVSVTYRTGALYVHRLWFYKHQHDNRVRSKLFVACQRWWFHWRFWFVPSVLGYTRTLSLETVHNAFEWNCQMVVVSRIWCGISAGQLYPKNHFE